MDDVLSVINSVAIMVLAFALIGALKTIRVLKISIEIAWKAIRDVQRGGFYDDDRR